MLKLRRINSALAISVVVLFSPGAALALAKYDVKQNINVDGRTAKHVEATLVNCQTGGTLAGPTETDDNGSVTWSQVEDGKACVRVEQLAGSGSTADVIDHVPHRHRA